jgi:hypothetical protein
MIIDDAMIELVKTQGEQDQALIQKLLEQNLAMAMKLMEVANKRTDTMLKLLAEHRLCKVCEAEKILTAAPKPVEGKDEDIPF